MRLIFLLFILYILSDRDPLILNYNYNFACVTYLMSFSHKYLHISGKYEI